LDIFSWGRKHLSHPWIVAAVATMHPRWPLRRSGGNSRGIVLDGEETFMTPLVAAAMQLL